MSGCRGGGNLWTGFFEENSHCALRVKGPQLFSLLACWGDFRGAAWELWKVFPAETQRNGVQLTPKRAWVESWILGHLECQRKSCPLLWGLRKQGAAASDPLEINTLWIKGYRSVSQDQIGWGSCGFLSWVLSIGTLSREERSFLSSLVERIKQIPSAVVEPDCCLLFSQMICKIFVQNYSCIWYNQYIE